MVEQKAEKLLYKINPLGKSFGIVFPEGTTEKEKRKFAVDLELARLQGRDIEIDPILKMVPLEEPQPEPTPVQPLIQPIVSPQPQVNTIQPQGQPTQQPQPPIQQTTPTPVTETIKETVITANPINPTQTTTSTQTVQAQGK